MKPRFDVFRKQAESFIKWVGTVGSLEDAARLIRIDSEAANIAEDEYVVVHSAYGTTETVKPLFDYHVIHHHS